MVKNKVTKKVETNLKENERLDDLERDNLFVIQNSKKYCFSIDSVLLSDFLEIKENDICLELCSGSGVISILANAKFRPKNICGLEIDLDLFDMSKRSLEYNNIHNIDFYNLDIRDRETVNEILQHKKFDVIFSNPPYLKPLKDMSRVSQKFHSTKYETTLAVKDIFILSKQQLKQDGKFFLIYTAPRLQELLCEAKANGFYLKKIQNVFFKPNMPSALVMCEFVLAPCDCEVMHPIRLND